MSEINECDWDVWFQNAYESSREGEIIRTEANSNAVTHGFILLILATKKEIWKMQTFELWMMRFSNNDYLPSDRI